MKITHKNISWLYRHIFLILILAIGVVSIYIFQGNPQRQMQVAVIISSLYFIWGIIHHSQEGDLHAKIVVEYLLVALLFLVFFRGAIIR